MMKPLFSSSCSSSFATVEMEVPLLLQQQQQQQHDNSSPVHECLLKQQRRSHSISPWTVCVGLLGLCVGFLLECIAVVALQQSSVMYGEYPTILHFFSSANSTDWHYVFFWLATHGGDCIYLILCCSWMVLMKGGSERSVIQHHHGLADDAYISLVFFLGGLLCGFFCLIIVIEFLLHGSIDVTYFVTITMINAAVFRFLLHYGSQQEQQRCLSLPQGQESSRYTGDNVV